MADRPEPLRLGTTAPNFKAETTGGPIDFHEFIGDGWVVLFSHPEDYTPVCTTELGAFAKLEPEFTKRGVKLIGLSANTVESHGGCVVGKKLAVKASLVSRRAGTIECWSSFHLQVRCDDLELQVRRKRIMNQEGAISKKYV